MLSRLTELDAFPKTLNEFAVRTESGGAVTLAGLSLCLLLFVGQVWEFFLARHALEQVVVDGAALHETLAVHFDVTFPNMACGKFAMATVDAAGMEQSMVEQSVFKLSLDAEGHAVGHAVQQDGSEQTLLFHDELKKKHDDHQQKGKQGGVNDEEEAEPRKPQHTSCGSCYGVDGAVEPLKCCNRCEHVAAAFAFRGWPWRPDGRSRFWQCRETGGVWGTHLTDVEHRELEHKPEHGCEVFGSLFVAKAKGSFHFGVSQQLRGNDIIAMLFGGRRDVASIDMSHQIHSLWFGGMAADKVGGHEYVRPELGFAALKRIDTQQARSYQEPLLGVGNKLKDASTVQYHVKVVGTDVVFLNGTVVSSNQYSATENVHAVRPGALPSLHFFYDTPPLRLRFTETSQSWAGLHTNMLALTGGVFAFMGIVDSLVYKNKLSSLNKAVRGRILAAKR